MDADANANADANVNANANADAGGSTIALHELCSGELKRKRALGQDLFCVICNWAV